MKSKFKFLAQVAAGLIASSGVALANIGGGFGSAPNVVPEPGSLSLVAIGVAGVYIAKRFFKNKK